MKKQIALWSIYALAEFGLSMAFAHFLETGNALGWFIMGFFLVLFNGAILSVAEDKSNVIMYKQT